MMRDLYLKTCRRSYSITTLMAHSQRITPAYQVNLFFRWTSIMFGYTAWCIHRTPPTWHTSCPHHHQVPKLLTRLRKDTTWGTTFTRANYCTLRMSNVRGHDITCRWTPGITKLPPFTHQASVIYWLHNINNARNINYFVPCWGHVAGLKPQRCVPISKVKPIEFSSNPNTGHRQKNRRKTKPHTTHLA